MGEEECEERESKEIEKMVFMVENRKQKHLLVKMNFKL